MEQDLDESLYDRGLRIRKEVLGADYVEAALQKADPFSRPFQDIVTEYCWGAAWGRPGLSRATRSLLNIAMLSVLNRQHELATHVRAALTNGVTKAEIQETLIQVAVYAGVPAGVEAFRTASTILTKTASEGDADRPSDLNAEGQQSEDLQ